MQKQVRFDLELGKNLFSFLSERLRSKTIGLGFLKFLAKDILFCLLCCLLISRSPHMKERRDSFNSVGFIINNSYSSFLSLQSIASEI